VAEEKIPWFFMMWRNEDITVEIGLSSTIAFPLLSAFTILLKASFSILLPISLNSLTKLLFLSLGFSKYSGFQGKGIFGISPTSSYVNS